MPTLADENWGGANYYEAVRNERGLFHDLFYEAKNTVDTCEKMSEVIGLNTRVTTGGCRSPGLRTDLKHMKCGVTGMFKNLILIKKNLWKFLNPNPSAEP